MVDALWFIAFCHTELLLFCGANDAVKTPVLIEHQCRGRCFVACVTFICYVDALYIEIHGAA
jgi:hypothetical protein